MIICSSALVLTANPNIVNLSWKYVGSFMVVLFPTVCGEKAQVHPVLFLLP